MPILVGQVSRVEIERRVEFASLPEGWAAVGFLVLAFALLWAIVWMYRHEGRAGASRRVRGVMAFLRCFVIVALLTVYLQPVLATYLHRWIDSYTVVLVDTSSSMDLQDRYRSADEIARVAPIVPEAGKKPVRRADVVGELLETGDRRLLRELAKNNRVRVCTFSDAPKVEYTIRAAREADFVEIDRANDPQGESLVSKPEEWRTRFVAQGVSTDVSQAVRETVESLGRSPVAGIVLLTDGGFNRGESADMVARFARDRRIPLHVVGIGDPAPPHNVRVAELIAPENVFAEDPFAIIAQIASQGMVGEEVTVELLERRTDSEDAGRVVATQTVRLGADHAVVPITFEHRQGAVGRYLYRVSIPPSETESVSDDNARQQTVNVIENRLRVLLVSGSPSWEYRYLTRLLQRDATFELSCWLQSADERAVRDGNVIIDHMPTSAEELFAYDAVLLLDPDPLEFTVDVSENLARLVSEHGGGLLYAAARLNAPGFVRDPATVAVTKILPVTFDPEADLILNQIGHYQKTAHPLWIEPSAVGHPVLRLPQSSEAYNWSAVGDVYWHYPVLRAKPVATVLMRHGDPRMENAYGRHVLLATQYVGAGRTAFLGFDGTWRWRAANEAIFNKFWVQTVRYLVEGKLAGGNQRGTILTEKDTYPLGEAIPVTARIFDARFAPLQVESVSAEYKLDGDRFPFTLRRLADRPGWYEGRIAPAHTGECELLLPIPGAQPGADVARREIQIVRPNLEILDPRMDRETLVALAEQSGGGRYYDVGEALKVADVIPDRHESTTIRSRPMPLWDDAWVLAVLLGLLLTEWTMRKVFRLL